MVVGLLPFRYRPVCSQVNTPSEHRSETILVIDDEPSVRTLIEKILTMRGYAVLAASDPEEALRLGSEHEVDAVVTDIMLPSMRGPELVEKLRGEGVILRELPGRNLIRVSCGYWTSDDDLERLMAALN